MSGQAEPTCSEEIPVRVRCKLVVPPSTSYGSESALCNITLEETRDNLLFKTTFSGQMAPVFPIDFERKAFPAQS